jgi:hypothetical protein
MSEIKLDPACFKHFPMAITNTGYLLPCCYCDDKYTLADPKFQKLMAVSKISDYETLDEIVSLKEWKDFEEDLRNHKGPDACMTVCRVKEDDVNMIRKDTWINPDDGKVEKVRNI